MGRTHNILPLKGPEIKRQVWQQGDVLYTIIGGIIYIVELHSEYPLFRGSMQPTAKLYKVIREAVIS